MDLSWKITGDAQAKATMLHLTQEAKTKIGLQAAHTVAPTLVAWVQKEAPQGEAGIMKASIGDKVKAYHGGEVVALMVGPRSGFKGMRPGRHKTSYAWTSPSRIVHLIVFGHKIVRGGALRRSRYQELFGPPSTARVVGQARPNPFIQRAETAVGRTVARNYGEICERLLDNMIKRQAKHGAGSTAT